MSKITYADKVALNTNTEIPAQNKVEDTDMNNIKGAVNEIGKYNTATAGTNGNFNVTLKGTLSSGDIVNISFPTATNGASNARLSIDNGDNYYNIKINTTNLRARDVQNINIKLLFDGSNFLILNSENIITGEISPTNSFRNGKRVYVKAIAISELPNAGTGQYAHGLDWVNIMPVDFKISGYESTTYYYQMPYAVSSGVQYTIGCFLDATYIQLRTGTDRSSINAIAYIYFIYK